MSNEPHSAAACQSVPDATSLRHAQIWLIDVETGELLAQWLCEAGLQAQAVAAAWDGPGPDGRVDLVLLGLPFPRVDGAQRVRRARERWPGARLVLLSPTFHPQVAADGSLARELNAQAVVALPVTREGLLAVVRRTLGASG